MNFEETIPNIAKMARELKAERKRSWELAQQINWLMVDFDWRGSNAYRDFLHRPSGNGVE